MSDTQVLAILIGGCVGMALAVPLCRGIFRWLDYRDMTRLNRMYRREAKRKGKR